MRLLDAGGLQVFEDDRGKVLALAVAARLLRDALDELAIFVYGQGAVRRDTLDRELPGHADGLFVLVGPVVQVFVVGLGGDGGVYLALPCNPQFPEFGQ